MSAAPLSLPLAPYERFMWRNDRPGYPVVFSIWLSLAGEVDERLLDQALAETTAWHPLLWAVISGRGRKARWTPAGSPPHRIEWTADSRSPIEPPDVSREPGLRVVGTKRADGADLVFHFHHACCDGVAGIEFLGDLSASYSQLVSGRSHAEPVRSLDPHALLDRYRGTPSAPLRQQIGHGAKLSAWLIRALAFRPSAMAADPERGGKRGTQDAYALFRLPEVRLEGEQMAALRATARQAEASLNDLLLAEVLLVVHRWNSDRGGGSRLRMMMPTNQRTSEQAGTPAANILGFEPIEGVIDDSTEFEELLADIRRKTAAVKQLRRPSLMDEWIAILAATPPLLDGLLAFPLPFYTGIVSNVGAPADHFWSHLPQADGKVLVGDARLEGVGFAPPVPQRTGISLGITAYGGQLSITGKADPFTVGAAGLERFLELLGNELRATARKRGAQPAASTG